MELDFSWLWENTAESPPESRSDGLNSIERGNMPAESEEPPENRPEPAADELKAGRLLSFYEQEREEREKLRRAYSNYQKSIRAAGILRTEILNDVKAGEPAAAILLKAVKCIALMTGDRVFYSTAEGSIKSIYGAGLLERTIIENEIRETRERLQKLQEALQRDTEPAESRGRIQEAVKAHEARIEELERIRESSEEAQR